MTKRLIFLAWSIGIAFILIKSVHLILVRASAGEAPSKLIAHQAGSMSDRISVYAAGRGKPWINLSDGRELLSG